MCGQRDDLRVGYNIKQIFIRMVKWLKKTYKRLFDNVSGNINISRGKIHILRHNSIFFSTRRGQDHHNPLHLKIVKHSPSTMNIWKCLLTQHQIIYSRPKTIQLLLRRYKPRSITILLPRHYLLHFCLNTYKNSSTDF